VLRIYDGKGEDQRHIFSPLELDRDRLGDDEETALFNKIEALYQECVGNGGPEVVIDHQLLYRIYHQNRFLDNINHLFIE